MRNRKEAGGYFEKLKIVLIVLSIFAAVKMLFFAFGLDEEYQLVMADAALSGGMRGNRCCGLAAVLRDADSSGDEYVSVPDIAPDDQRGQRFFAGADLF